LKDNKDRLSTSQQNELLSQIDIASIRLNRQVENLLNMSRLESGMLKLNLDWCDINELIYSVIQKLSIYNDQHAIVFQHNDQLPLFKLDAGLIEQVLHNIIFNAIQYTPENTSISISVKDAAENCIIAIEDNGNGFPASEIQYAFDKFYRLPQTKAGGTGLGLSIVKGFIEAHNGVIVLENNSSGGAKFTISIPSATSFIKNLKQES
jgi:two-component system sensor histidine kinase KdpD